MSPELSRPNPENPNINRQTTIKVAQELALKKITNIDLLRKCIATDWINNLFDDLSSRNPITQSETVAFDLLPVSNAPSDLGEIVPEALELAKKIVLQTIMDSKYSIHSELTLGVAMDERSELYPVKTEEGRTIVEINTLIPSVILKYFFTDDQDKTLIGGRELIISPLNSSL